MGEQKVEEEEKEKEEEEEEEEEEEAFEVQRLDRITMCSDPGNQIYNQVRGLTDQKSPGPLRHRIPALGWYRPREISGKYQEQKGTNWSGMARAAQNRVRWRGVAPPAPMGK